jgi:hypothetical protein
MTSGPLNPEMLVLHDAQIQSITVDRAENEMRFFVERHPHWVARAESDALCGALDITIAFTGIYDFDFDCGSVVLGFTIDSLEQQLDNEATVDFPVWRWVLRLQEGEILIRATGALAAAAPAKAADNEKSA